MGAGHDHHGHAHHHGHGHSHAPASYGTAFAVGITLNIAFVIIEAGAGFVADSVALIADAGHNLSDVLGLVVAWGAIQLSRRAPSKRFTYGLRRSSILAALFNAMFLLVATGAIAFEAVQRIMDPRPVEAGIVLVVASIGIVINGVTAWLFASGSHDDINIRGAFLHMLADAAVSAGVVLSALLALMTGWFWWNEIVSLLIVFWLDPVISLIIAGIIIGGTWGLLRDSVTMALDAVPSRIDAHAVEDALCDCAGVTCVHDLHIWPMSTTDVALTAHLVMPGGHPGDAALHDVAHMLEHRFGIGHATLQVETGAADVTCKQAAAHSA